MEGDTGFQLVCTVTLSKALSVLCLLIVQELRKALPGALERREGDSCSYLCLAPHSHLLSLAREP